MKINELEPEAFRSLVYHQTPEFLRLLNTPEVFIVKSFFDKDYILGLRRSVFQMGQQSEPSWHPLYDGCPDYHRHHDNYEKAYVKGKIHTFYFHSYYEKNAALFEKFNEIFRLKNALAGERPDATLGNLPSQGWVARVNLHHYPRGGGYQAEHTDPDGKYAKMQIVVQASQKGKDFADGGVYVRKKLGAEPIYLDGLTEPGDLIVIAPAIPHGVAPIDQDRSFDWNSEQGRWIVLPIIVHSDYPTAENVKPVQVK
jgi:hypothetical protein